MVMDRTAPAHPAYILVSHLVVHCEQRQHKETGGNKGLLRLRVRVELFRAREEWLLPRLQELCLMSKWMSAGGQVD